MLAFLPKIDVLDFLYVALILRHPVHKLQKVTTEITSHRIYLLLWGFTGRGINRISKNNVLIKLYNIIGRDRQTAIHSNRGNLMEQQIVISGHYSFLNLI